MAAVADLRQTPNKTKQTKSSYRPEIDGLRAFAVIAVIINHFNKDLLPSGYLGVDIFFVISGYVISSSLSGRESKNFGDFLSGFYERRIKRLVPALVVFVLVTSILICLFNPDPGTALKTGMASLFGLSNLYLFKQSTDYFAQSTELNPFTHTWSLGVEEQFYLLFPFLIWFSGFGRQAKNGARNLFAWIGALTVASLTSFICLYQTNQPAAYFLMPPRFWEMAAGCLIFIGFQKRANIEQALEKVPPLLVVTAIVAVMFLPISWAVPGTILIVVLSAILIACLKSGTAAFRIFTQKRVVHIGLISYSLYLWHWLILSISRWSIGIHWWSIPFQVALMIAVAEWSFNNIERRFRGIQKSSPTMMLKAIIAAPFAASIAIGVFSKTGVAGQLFIGDKSKTSDKIFGETEYWNMSSCGNGTWRQDPSIFNKCLIKNNKTKAPRSIPPGINNVNRTSSIFFYGDSHMQMLMHSPALYLKKGGKVRNFYSYYTSGCLNSPAITNDYSENCINDYKAFLAFFFRTSKKNDSLVVTTSYQKFIGRADEYHWKIGAKIVNAQNAWKAYLKELDDLSRSLHANGRKLIVVTSTPLLEKPNDFQFAICRQWFAEYQCVFSASSVVIDKENKRFYKDMLRLRDIGVSVVDIYSPIDSILRQQKNFDIVKFYRDRDHITKSSVEILHPLLNKEVYEN